jgi:pimeloyl-ACP methyl ester carboxylesterase
MAGTNGFGDYLYGNLYYPTDDTGKAISESMPVVIYLHEYAYATGFGRRGDDIIKGFTSRGFAVFVYDQIGFGTRIDDGTFFYHRYPHWSKLGRMAADVSAAVDALANMKVIDKNRIYATGYSLGGTVALYSAALDERIKGVVSVCGFTPMRLDTAEKGTEGIRGLADLHGLQPRLGFFLGHEERIPYDYHEVLAAIAPRPLLIAAPLWDRYATFADVNQCVNEAGKVYDLLGAAGKIELYAPRDFNRFSAETLKKVLDWSAENFK